MSLKQKLSYLLKSALSIGQEKTCPYCKQKNLLVIDKKYLVTTLLKCNNCGLNHRHPKDDEKWLNKFYQNEYNVEYGIETYIITEIPSDDEIIKLKQTNFRMLPDYNKYIEALFKTRVNIIDYGCSWGYNVYKLIQSGHKVVGFEISVPRAELGKKKLAVPIFSDINQLPKENNLIFSSHVIEHLSNIEEFITFSQQFLNERGVFMAFCPNGSEEYRNREPDIWHVNWGLVHPNYLDVLFAKNMFKHNPYLILTADWDFNPQDIYNWDGVSQVVGSKLDGKELLIISKPNIKIN